MIEIVTISAVKGWNREKTITTLGIAAPDWKNQWAVLLQNWFDFEGFKKYLENKPGMGQLLGHILTTAPLSTSFWYAVNVAYNPILAQRLI